MNSAGGHLPSSTATMQKSPLAAVDTNFPLLLAAWDDAAGWICRCPYCQVAGIGDNASYRRLPSLLCRGVPNPLAVAAPTRSSFRRSADLEIGDTAGLETCGTVVYPTHLAVYGQKNSTRCGRLRLLGPQFDPQFPRPARLPSSDDDLRQPAFGHHSQQLAGSAQGA